MLTHNWMLLPHFYNGFYFICDLIELFRSIFSSWSMYPNFVYHECIYQYIRLSTWTQMYLSTHKIINMDTNVFINMEDYQHRCKCIYQQLSDKSWKADSSAEKKSSCEEYAPHTTKYILGVYSLQYPTFLISQVSLYQ